MTLDELIEDLTDRILITHDRDDHGHWSFGELPTDADTLIQAYADACVAEAQRWIPVSEPPKLLKRVLWWSTVLVDGWYVGFLAHDWRNDLVVWYGDFSDDWAYLNRFSHWQPLPPAPTAEPLT